MKKLFFGLLATIMFSAVSFAQVPSDVAKKGVVNAQMVTLVNCSRVMYVKGQSYNDFIRALTLPSPTVPSQDELFRKVYGYLNSGTADCDILRADNSILGKFAQELSTSTRNLSTPNATFSERKKWWQHLLNGVVNAVLDFALPLNTVTIDMWPEEETK